MEEIKKLSVDERIRLAEAIWDSIEEDTRELSNDEKKELERRIYSIESGQAKMYTWEEVKRSLNLDK